MGIFDEDITGVPDPNVPPVPVPTIPLPRPRPGADYFAPAPARTSGGFDEDIYSPPPQPPPTKNAVDWSQYGKPFGEISSGPTPGLTERTKEAAADLLMKGGMSPYRANQFGDVAATAAGFTPVGPALSAGDVAADLSNKQYLKAGIDAFGAVPGALQIKRGVQALRGTLPAWRIAETPTRALDPATGQIVDELKDAGSALYDKISKAPLEYRFDAIDHYGRLTKNALVNGIGGNAFSPEAIKSVTNTLDEFSNSLRRRNATHVTPQDFDTLRQQLRSFTDGADAAAAERAASILDAYVAHPPAGMYIEHVPGALDTVRSDMQAARENWRAYKTAQGAESEIERAAITGSRPGRDAGAHTRARFQSLLTTPEGQSKIFGALPDERQALTAVVAGTPTVNALDRWGSRLGAGQTNLLTTLGSMGAGGFAGGYAAPFLAKAGIDPVTSSIIGGVGGALLPNVGNALKSAASSGTIRQAEEVVAQIRRNSPLYRAREAANPPITYDPRAMARDAIAYALMPQAVRGAKNRLDLMNTPYANRGESYQPEEQP